MPTEDWKDIVGYIGLYQISNHGNVKNVVTNIILKNSNTGHGYYKVVLCKNGKQKKQYVHRLVAQAFLDNINGYTIINHKDSNGKNNHVSNLEWCTQGHNMKHAYVNGRLNSCFLKNNYSVRCYTKDGRLYGEYYSQHEAARKTGSNFKLISFCVLGRRKTHNNFIWKRVCTD